MSDNVFDKKPSECRYSFVQHKECVSYSPVMKRPIRRISTASFAIAPCMHWAASAAAIASGWKTV